MKEHIKNSIIAKDREDPPTRTGAMFISLSATAHAFCAKFWFLGLQRDGAALSGERDQKNGNYRSQLP